MPSTFPKAVNYNDLLPPIVLAVPHAAGATSLILPAGAGARFGTLAANRIFRVTALRAAGTPFEVVLAVFEATGIIGDALQNISGAEGFSNVALPVGTTIEVRPTAKDYEDHSSAINANETAIALRALDSAVVHTTGNEVIGGRKWFVDSIQGVYFNVYLGGTFLLMPSTGPSGIGVSTSSPFAAYCDVDGAWFNNAHAGDFAYRNTAGSLLFGTSSIGWTFAITAAGAVFAGTPTAPTAAPGTNTTQIATCEFVLANVGSATTLVHIAGSETVTGAKTFTAPLTAPVRDKGGQVYNVKSYGAVGDGVADDTAAIQAAIDAAGAAGGGTVFFPLGHYITSAPLRVGLPCVSLLGCSGAQFGIGPVIYSYGAHPIIHIVPAAATTRADLTYGAALVGPGSGAALAVNGGASQNGATFLDFRDAQAMDIDGLGAFTAELFFRMTGLPQSYQVTLLTCGGQRTLHDPVHTTFDLWTDQNRALSAHLNVGGVLRSLNSATGVVLDNTTYHVALTYDGTTVRLFLGVAGAAATLVASVAATGTIVCTPTENGSIGPYRQVWPRGGAYSGTIDGRIDSIRFSNVARYTAPYTAPNAKLPFVAGTLLLENWDDEVQDFSRVQTSLGLTWLPKYWAFEGTLLSRIEIGNLSLQTSYGMGIRSCQTIESYFHDLMIWGTVWGMDFWQNNFLNSFYRIKFAAGGLYGRVGLAAYGAAGICDFRKIQAQAYEYGFILCDGSGSLSDSWFNGNCRVPVFLRTANLSIDSLFTTNEDVTSGKFETCLWIGDSVSVAVRNSTFEVFAYPRPAIIVDGGDVVTLDTINVELHPAATEAIKVLSPTTARPPLLINPSFGRPGYPRNIPWSTGTVAFAGTANPDGSLTLARLADSAAANDTLYYSTTQNKPCYKIGGVSNPLY